MPPRKTAATKAASTSGAARRSSTPKGPTAGQKLIAEFSEDDDPWSLTFQVGVAAQTADHLEWLTQLLNGDRQAWVQVKLGAKTVEVVVNDLLKQYRAQAVTLQRMIVEIKRQRAALASGPDDDDVLDDDDG